MKSRVIKSLVIVVACIALAAVALGFASPDGVVKPINVATPEVTSTPATDQQTETDQPDQADAGDPDASPADPAARAADTAADIWPGRPGAATQTDGVINWCPAVSVSVSAAARAAVGQEAAHQAACRAVAFVFDVRYSRLSLPRQSYTESDFEPMLAALTDQARSRTYPSRLAAVITRPRDESARRASGLVLLNGPQAGAGRSFFGTDWSDDGYRDRAVWVNPTWTVVSVDLVSTSPRLLLSTSFDASAAVPVRNASAGTTELLVVPTSGSFTVAAPDWRIDGWTLKHHSPSFAAFSLNS